MKGKKNMKQIKGKASAAMEFLMGLKAHRCNA